MVNTIAVVSDIHLEFRDYGYILPSVENESDTILVLAGDISPAKTVHLHTDFFNDCVDRFKDVIYIMGNHEHYGGNFTETYDHIRKFLPEDIHFINNDWVIIDGVKFVCGTMWSLIPDEDYAYVKQNLSDYYVISNFDRKFIPFDSSIEFNKFIKFLLNEVNPDEKTVVVTHHAPSYKSVADMYLGDRLNCAFSSNCDDLIGELKPNVWIHGHHHSSSYYMLHDTRVICNPVGYPNENNEFNMTIVKI